VKSFASGTELSHGTGATAATSARRAICRTFVWRASSADARAGLCATRCLP
jgi:hypothetical protein